ncbi:pilus assembly protein FimV [Formivibrio citricus]|uniref:Pilus assembly protein FimV n=1 Tax=Formivibrio citricus TaxID=83765 RepID=A0A1I4V8R7_9NEIS|nr:FimV/HubP family polar landmark protein [Formivibrio citricus]SFM97596.1 pilus assembly protein FimV [Formivibrio citricus]
MPTKPRFKACVLAVALTMLPWCAEAAGLGRLNVLSGLGQPFKGEIELVAVQPQEAETLKVALASAEAYASVQMAYPAPSLGLRFALNKRESGQYVVSVSSSQAIDEPVFNLLVELSWAGGLVKREYTALIDPVGYSGVPGGATISPVAAPNAARMDPVSTPSAQISGAIRPPKAVRTVRKGKHAAVAASGVASKPAAQPVEAGESQVVKSGDTLSKIANQVKPEGVSLEQVLVGLYQANPDAFNGNMNRLKRGKILRIPSSEEFGKQDQAQAVKEIKVHSANWQNYRRQLAESAAKGAAAETEAPQGGGRITAKVEDKGAQQTDKSKDVLKLSRGASKTDGQQAKIRALEEEASARKKALDEANQRVAELQKNIQEMEKSVALKSQQGAELQKKAEQAKASMPASAPAVVTPIASAPAAASAVASKPVAASVVASAVQPQPAPKPKRVAPPPPPEPTFMDMLADNALMIGGGLLAVVLGIGGLIWARNRRRPSVFENSLITSGDLKPNTVLGRTGGGVISTQAENSFLTDFSRQGLGSIDTDEVDPIAEADVYMAYGRDAQAEEILKDALIKDPQRQEVRMKLLDIYAARKDKVSFQEVAAEVFAATGGQGQYWEQASYLGRSLDPENPLYTGKNGGTGAGLAVGAAVGVAAAATVAAVALSSSEGVQAAPAGEPEMEPLESIGEMQSLEPEEAPVGLDFEFELPEPEQSLEPEASAAAVLDLSDSAVDELGSMDFAVESEQTAELSELESTEEAFGLELDLGEGLELPVAPEETLQATAEGKGSDLMELDLPIDLGAPEMPEFASAFTEPATETAPEQTLPEEKIPSAEPELTMPEFEMPDLDLSLDLGDERPVEEGGAMEAAAIASFSEELSMEEPLVAETHIPGGEAVEASLPQEESIDLDFGFTAPEAVAAPAPVVEEPIDISLEIGEGSGTDKLDFVADDPVQTKIELARAYIDMGDVEGAREILQEAEQEGNPTQQELARNLLAAL